MIIQGQSKTDDLPNEVIQSLGFMLDEAMAVREGDTLGFPIITKSDGSQLNLYPVTLVLNLKSFDRLGERVRVIQGRLPEEGFAVDDYGRRLRRRPGDVIAEVTAAKSRRHPGKREALIRDLAKASR